MREKSVSDTNMNLDCSNQEGDRLERIGFVGRGGLCVLSLKLG